MYKILILTLSLVVGLVASSLADIIILNNGTYIDEALLIGNDSGQLVYQKDNQTYSVPATSIEKISQEQPREGVAVANDELVIYTGSVGKKGETPFQPKFAATLGFLQGGGSLVGVDLEWLLGDSIVAIQAGGGLVGFGAAINFHFEPTIHSNYISLCYWNQGINDLYARHAGLTYGIRAWDWLNAQIGVGLTLDVSDKMKTQLEEQGVQEIPPVLLLYSLGVYF